MAGLASSCLQGDALLWHAELDPEVQHDWRLLQQALIKQYITNNSAQVNRDLLPIRLLAERPLIGSR